MPTLGVSERFQKEQVLRLRLHLCRIIAESTVKDPKEEEVQQIFIPLKELSDVLTVNPGLPLNFPVPKDGIKDDGVTPIMISCDRNQVSFLRALLHLIRRENHENELGQNEYRNDLLSRAIGTPYDFAAKHIGGNSAAHFAAAAGSVTCLTELNRVLEGMGKDVLTLRNAHNDTPPMIAVAKHQLDAVDYLVDCARILLKDNKKAMECPFLELRNNSADSALLLAVDGGQIKAVKCILDYAFECIDSIKLVTILQRYTEWGLKIKKKLNKISSSGSSPLTTVDEEKRQNVFECINFLLNMSSKAKERVDIESSKAMESLLIDEAEAVSFQKLSHQKDIKKKKKKKRERNQLKQLKREESGDINKPDSMVSESLESLIKPHFVTLANGLVVDKSMKEDGQLDVDEEGVIGSDGILCHEKHNEDISPAKLLNHLSPKANALSLEVSSFFLGSPQAMAMALSPSQLELVGEILENQLDKVTKAHQIQFDLQNQFYKADKNGNK